MNNQDNEKVFQKSNINWYPGHMAKTRRQIKENISLVDIIYEINPFIILKILTVIFSL